MRLKEGEERWPKLFTLGMGETPNRSIQIVLLRGTKTITVGRSIGARNGRREEEEGGREKKRKNGARPFSDREEAPEGGKEREEGLKKAPSTEGRAATGQTRRLGDFLIKCLLEWVF